jgi:hypothetical protein
MNYDWARKQSLGFGFYIDAFDQNCHEPTFTLQTVNLYNTVFRQDQIV